jgi:hypothetical protein
MRQARDAKPVLDLARLQATSPVLSLNGQDLSLATFLEKR